MKYYSAALLILSFTFGIILCAALGFYPVALIAPTKDSGGRPHIIWARSVRRVAHTTLIYYKHALGTASSTLAITRAINNEVYEKSRTALIDQTFIADAARHAATETEIRAFMEEKLTRSNAHPNFETAVSLLYGLDGAGFIELIARPEAEKELLKKKRGWDDVAFNAWLTQTKQKSQIVIF